ncbi:transcriptional regulator, ArsR family [Cellulomonas flavigena DSM 20109]|uniref:Transcriptional regulator, ArsR family n=1 Tax=Cellulomonas flavigena (strain ATCC 482 / DSM 20109 / BCRC 11376 / JCM 18109 / NBRC 3775 / NCIMB 8073 / NRS 134) TaxID=446466 RepID=D5UC66_CELFN|nr:metalloregulator ArsR/SmtB family transcription factor [Cellulomonas flavigena]ADG76225.1 transcriptional regulator, ArsR family [Cellulomonas flavigena DSM 20109]
MADGVFAALSHPTRRAVLRELARRDWMLVGELADALDVAGPTLSGHLRILREADLVVAERRGTTIRYSANASVVESAFAAFLHSLGVGRAAPPTD